MHIVLVEPEIPANTGNIVRTCAVTGTKLHLVRPLGFSVEDKYLKRAGLDYWHDVDISYYDSVYEVLERFPESPRFLLTTKTRQSYTDARFREDSLLIFGKETKGLPEDFRQQYAADCYRIPMLEGARCLNLSNSVAVVLYEALRQLNFTGGKFV